MEGQQRESNSNTAGQQRDGDSDTAGQQNNASESAGQQRDNSDTAGQQCERLEDTIKEPDPPDVPIPHFRKEECENFLRLATSLHLIMGMTVTEDSIQRAQKLYEEYLFEFKEVC